MKMKKLSLILLLFVFFAACGSNDEPEKPNEITRVQDGNGKAFLENGRLVDANFNFKEAQLIEALKKYEWNIEYSFYYDNKKVSGKEDISGLPIRITTDGHMEWTSYIEGQKNLWTLTLDGKNLTATWIPSITAGSIEFPKTFIVMTLDLSGETGRIIMDYKTNGDVQGYDSASLYVRMVWKGTVPQ